MFGLNGFEITVFLRGFWKTFLSILIWILSLTDDPLQMTDFNSMHSFIYHSRNRDILCGIRITPLAIVTNYEYLVGIKT